jgi:hypothetical protein
VDCGVGAGDEPVLGVDPLGVVVGLVGVRLLTFPLGDGVTTGSTLAEVFTPLGTGLSEAAGFVASTTAGATAGVLLTTVDGLDDANLGITIVSLGG